MRHAVPKSAHDVGSAAGAGRLLLALTLVAAMTGARSETHSTLAAPRIVYTPVDQALIFSGMDGVSGESRTMSMSAAISPSCNPTAGNGYSVAQCGHAEMLLTDLYGGTLLLPGTTKVQSNPNIWRTASGAIVEGDNPTDPALAGGPVLSIRLNGTLAQLNGALAALSYLPAVGYEDRTFDERSPPGVGTPRLDVLVHDGSAGAIPATATVVLRVEGDNGAPNVSGPGGPLLAVANTDNFFPIGEFDPAVMTVIDPELCLRGPSNRCGGAYDQPPAPIAPEPNDAMLLVLWIVEPNCGRFALRSTSGFGILGGLALPSVNAMLTSPSGLGLAQDAADAILATLGSAGARDLSAQTTGFTPVFAGVAADLADVRYALSRLAYRAPPGNVTCHLGFAFSDLGNNGMPIAWLPADNQAQPPRAAREIPDAAASVTTVAFAVVDPNIVFSNGFE